VDDKGAEPQADGVGSLGVGVDAELTFQGDEISLRQSDAQALGTVSTLHSSHALQKGHHSRSQDSRPDQADGHR
jgi:hypothetical protein